MDTNVGVRMTRRSFIRAAGTAAGTAAAAAVLQACGGGTATNTPAAKAATAATGATPASAAVSPAAGGAPTATVIGAASTLAAAQPTSTFVPATVAAPAVKKNFNGATIKIAASTEYYAYALRQFRDQIEKEGNLKLNIDVVPGTDLFQRNITEYTTQSTSYDVTMFLPFQLPDYAPHLEPIKPIMDKNGFDLKLDDIMPVFRNVYTTWGGTMLAVSFDGDLHMMYYNRDAFETTALVKQYKDTTGKDLAAPVTWDDYASLAQFFTETPWRKDGQKGYGTAEGLGGPNWWWQNRLGAYGGVYFDESLNPLINSKNAVLATDNLVKVAAFMPPGSNNFGYQETENALTKSDVALSVNWSSTGRVVTDPKKSAVVGKIGFAVTPGAVVNGKTLVHPALPTGWSLGIPKYGKQKDAASYVVWFYSQPEVHLHFCLDPETGIDAYRASVLVNDQFITRYSKPYVDTIKASLPIGFPDLQVPGSSAYYTPLNDALSQAITKVKPTADALNTAADAWNKISDRVGKQKQTAAWNQAYTAMKAQGLEYKPIT
ncbi:MAG: hypothetical protein M3Y58_18625 [Chloroflexota bacterium]|nr:hypothetical protein [Chloroflexota bacterium]